MKKVRNVATMEMVSHAGWTFQSVIKNRCQSKLKSAQR